MNFNIAKFSTILRKCKIFCRKLYFSKYGAQEIVFKKLCEKTKYGPIRNVKISETSTFFSLVNLVNDLVELDLAYLTYAGNDF